MKLATFELDNFQGVKRFEDPERDQTYEITSGEDLVLWLNEDKADTTFVTNVEVTSLDAWGEWHNKLSSYENERGMTVSFHRDPDDFSPATVRMSAAQAGKQDDVSGTATVGDPTFDTGDNLLTRTVSAGTAAEAAVIWEYAVDEPMMDEVEVSVEYKVADSATSVDLNLIDSSGTTFVSNTTNSSTSLATITESFVPADHNISPGDRIEIYVLVDHDGTNDGHVGGCEITRP